MEINGCKTVGFYLVTGCIYASATIHQICLTEGFCERGIPRAISYYFYALLT